MADEFDIDRPRECVKRIGAALLVRYAAGRYTPSGE
jgi:hypothetical protein